MNKRISQAAVLMLATVPMVAQQQSARTGVSNPEPVTIDANNQDVAATSNDEGRRPITGRRKTAAGRFSNEPARGFWRRALSSLALNGVVGLLLRRVRQHADPQHSEKGPARTRPQPPGGR